VKSLSLATVDAGGGLAPWTVSVEKQSLPAGVTLVPQAAVVAGAPVSVQLAV
jgi:hypothetical protein